MKKVQPFAFFYSSPLLFSFFSIPVFQLQYTLLYTLKKGKLLVLLYLRMFYKNNQYSLILCLYYCSRNWETHWEGYWIISVGRKKRQQEWNRPRRERERRKLLVNSGGGGGQDLILVPHKMISVRPRAFVASREGKKKGEWKRWLNQ